MPVRILFMIVGLVALESSTASAQAPPSKPALDSPGEGWVTVRLSTELSGDRVSVCWRRESREGYRWLEGQRGADDRWLQGHWQPAHMRAGQVWVPGHPGHDARWRLGFWRPESIEGFVWIDGYWLSGVWQHGHWSPTTLRAGYVWVHGHVGEDAWIIGHWRAGSRSGSVWVPAHWRRGVWMHGFWHLGAWTWDAHHAPVPYAQPETQNGQLNRELAAKIVHPRYAASLIAKPVTSRRERQPERDERERPESEREKRDAPPDKSAAARKQKKPASKKVYKRSLYKKRLRRPMRVIPRAKSSPRRSGGRR